MNKLISISQCWTEKIPGKTIGASGDLVNTYAGDDIGTMLDDLKKIFIMYAIQNIVPPLMACMIWPRQKKLSSLLSPRIGR